MSSNLSSKPRSLLATLGDQGGHGACFCFLPVAAFGVTNEPLSVAGVFYSSRYVWPPPSASPLLLCLVPINCLSMQTKVSRPSIKWPLPEAHFVGGNIWRRLTEVVRAGALSLMKRKSARKKRDQMTACFILKL